MTVAARSTGSLVCRESFPQSGPDAYSTPVTAGRCRAISVSVISSCGSLGGHRSLGLDPTQTPEFTKTPGEVVFTPDGGRLVVTTKANGNNIDVFAVNRFGGLSAKPVVNADPGQVPFEATFDAGGHLVVSEAANAVATFTVNADGTLAPSTARRPGKRPPAGSCAATRTSTRPNAGSASLSGYHDDGSGALTALGTTATDAGTVDAAVSFDGR